MSDIRFLYITVANEADARKLAEQILKERLAACANIFPVMESIYWWKGELESARESVLILKTHVDLVEKATAAVRHWHSYTTPCILSLAIESGDQPYIDWLRGEVNQ